MSGLQNVMQRPLQVTGKDLRACAKGDADNVPECKVKREVNFGFLSKLYQQKHIGVIKTFIKHRVSMLLTHPQSYFACKRGMVDMRSRIQGNKGF